jgi:hypothetical protein
MKIKIPLQLVELETGNFHLIATGTFPDGTTGNWAVDTGASKTVFDKNLASFYSVSPEKMKKSIRAGLAKNPWKQYLSFYLLFRWGSLKPGK